MALREWLRAENIYDVEVERILQENNVNNPEDFANVTEKQYDEINRDVMVARKEETKDNESRMRLEKKMAKLKAHWRKLSGIKATSVTAVTADDDSKLEEAGGSRSRNEEAMAKSGKLKKFMQAQGFWELELFMVLSSFDVTEGEEIAKQIDTQKKFDEVIRQVKVARFQETTDSASKQRLEKLLSKFEAHWRKVTGIKKTSVKSKGKGGKEKHKEKAPQGSKAMREEAMKKGREMKKSMQKGGFFEVELLIVLVSFGCETEADICSKIDTQKKFDEVIRQVKVVRFQETTDSASKQRLEKLLSKFEAFWRKGTGIKKTSVKAKGKKKGKTKGKDKTAKGKQMEAMTGEGKELKTWMRSNAVWEKDLYNELLANSVRCEADLKKLDTKAFDEIVRKVRVQRFTEISDTASRGRLDKLLVKFETLWRKQSGIKKTSLTAKSKGKGKGKGERG